MFETWRNGMRQCGRCLFILALCNVHFPEALDCKMAYDLVFQWDIDTYWFFFKRLNSSWCTVSEIPKNCKYFWDLWRVKLVLLFRTTILAYLDLPTERYPEFITADITYYGCMCVPQACQRKNPFEDLVKNALRSYMNQKRLPCTQGCFLVGEPCIPLEICRSYITFLSFVFSTTKIHEELIVVFEPSVSCRYR